MPKETTVSKWTKWSKFPNPNEAGYLTAPIGPGVYELRHISTSKKIVYGRSTNVAYRMTSLLPKPLGAGTRNNAELRNYVWDNIADIEYRTIAYKNREDAEALVQALNREEYLF